MRTIDKIVEKVEALETDSFAKFYIYCTLLRIRAEKIKCKGSEPADFQAILPVYSLPFLPEVRLRLGKPTQDFYALVGHYSHYDREDTYDAARILQMMRSHLDNISKESTKTNSHIYDASGFEICKENIKTYLSCANTLNLARLTLVERVGNTALALSLTTLCMLKLWSGSFILGLLILAIATLVAYKYIYNTKKDLDLKKASYTRSLSDLQNGVENFTMKDLYNKFFIASIAKPVSETTKFIKEAFPLSEDTLAKSGFLFGT